MADGYSLLAIRHLQIAMSNKDFKPEQHQASTERQLIIGGIVLTLLIGLTFVAFTYGQGAFVCALGAFGLVGVMIVMVWLALKVIEWAGGKDE
jgi:hypothetical protein